MAHKIVWVVILTSLLVFISGCAAVGTYVEEEKLSLLKENVSTKEEILELIGPPDGLSPGEGGKGQIFAYSYIKSKPSFMTPLSILYDESEMESHQVSLFIDDTGILRKITVDDRPYKIRTGLLAK